MPNGTSTASPGPGDGCSETDATIAPAELKGTLVRPVPGCGVVRFAHGRGSGGLSPRNRLVASRLQEAGLGTLIFDLLLDKKAADRLDIFDIPPAGSTACARVRLGAFAGGLGSTPLGYFGASTGTGPALLAETQIQTRQRVAAVVSRIGRLDLARGALADVRANAADPRHRGSRRDCVEPDGLRAAWLQECGWRSCHCGDIFWVEPGSLDEVARLARAWFLTHLTEGETP